MDALAAIKWGNQRLDDGCSAIEGQSITPAFKIMGLGDMPVTLNGRFVLVKSQVNSEGNVLQESRKLEVCGRCEDGIPAKDKQDVDMLGLKVLGQLLHSLHLIRGM